MNQRRSFNRIGEEGRRSALIEATLDLIAEHGAQAATVRAIALRAGVTPGLIRHYFATKEDLVAAAHVALMTGLTDASSSRLADLPDDPHARLSVFVTAAVTPPVADPRALSLWAATIHQVPRDPALRAAHRQTYLAFRDQLESLIAAVLRADGRPPDLAHMLAIAGNAVIDGLWIEASALPKDLSVPDLSRLVRLAFSRLLDTELPEA